MLTRHSPFMIYNSKDLSQPQCRLYGFLKYSYWARIRFIYVLNRINSRAHDGLNPAHVPFKWVNNPTLCKFYFTMIGRADIEESKSNVALSAWLPQASYPCGNFSDTLNLKTKYIKKLRIDRSHFHSSDLYYIESIVLFFFTLVQRFCHSSQTLNLIMFYIYVLR